MKSHPQESLLKELASGLAEEHQELLAHVTECAECRKRFRAHLASGGEGPLPEALAQVLYWPAGEADYGPVLDRVEWRLRERQQTLSKERAEAPGLFAELTGRAAEKWPLLLRNNPRFATWGLYELLLERSREEGYRDPARGESLARLGLSLADLLEVSYYGAERIDDLRARAWGLIANSLRRRSDFTGSEEAFRTAFTLLRSGTGDSLERAMLLDLKASLRSDQRRFSEALRLLRRALAVFAEVGERHRAGRVLVSMETVHHYAGTPEQGIPLLYQALELIDPVQEPRLLLCAWHNLIDDLAELGRYLEAQKLLGKAREIYERHPEPWTQSRRRWVEGKIARGLGWLAEAESHLLAVRQAFLSEDLPYDTALVSLDLAALYAEQGRAAELERLAEEMVPIFSSRQIHREALAALTLWYRAVRMRAASSELVHEVASYLKRSRYNPELRFGESS